MICQRCTKDVAGDGVHTCTPSDLVRKLEEHRDALLIDLAASLGREDAIIKQRYGLLVAAENLIRVKGRHHTEQAYKQLEAAIAKVKP